MTYNKKTQHITLHDIALKTGYSVNTVSHALRDMPDVAPETAKHIQEVARSMDYVPNNLASSLRSGHTQTIAVIVGSMSNPFYGIMVDILQECAQLAGYTLMIMCSREDPDIEYKLVEQAINRRVDGVLLFPNAYSNPTVDRLREANIPFVLMSRALKQEQADSIVCDEELGAYLATMHLLEHGVSKPVYLAASTVVFASEQRIHGFLRACREAGIPDENRRICVMSDLPAAEEGLPVDTTIPAEQLLALKKEGFNGLFIFCDIQAWRVLYALHNTPGISPDDFSIVSFDNIEGILSFPFSLCSIDCNYKKVAQEGFDLLRARINGDNRPPQNIVFPVHLVCRGSCGRNLTQMNISTPKES